MTELSVREREPARLNLSLINSEVRYSINPSMASPSVEPIT